MRRATAVLALACTAVFSTSCFERPPEFGVSVFASDTLPVVFTVSLTDQLVMSLRSAKYQSRPDKSLWMTTPAQMIILRGAGTATIVSISGGRLVVQPLGLNPDSADTSSAEGLGVRLTRTGEQRSVKLVVEKQ